MNRRTYLIIIYVITIAAIVIGSSLHLGWSIFSLRGCGRVITPSGNYQEKTWDNLSFDSLDINCSVSTVTISYGNANKVYYHGPEELIPKVEVSGKELRVSQPKIRFNVKGNSNQNSPSIEITIKKGLELKSSDISLSVGTLKIDEIMFTKLQSSVDVGELYLSKVSITDSSTFDCNVGDIHLSDCTFEDLKVSSDVGDITISGSTFENLTGKTGTGDITLRNFKDDNYAIDISTGVGGITYMGERYKKEFVIKNRNAKYRLSLDSGVGDIDVK